MCGCGSTTVAVSKSPKVGCGCGGSTSSLGAVKKDCGCGCGGRGSCGDSAKSLGSTKTISVLRGVGQGHQYAPSTVVSANGGSTKDAFIGVLTLSALCLGITVLVQKASN